ncbi:hypothetical protein D3C76_1700520 [compost metagenome]
MINYRPKHRVKVDGQMTPQGADRAGNKLANAALILAVGLAIAAIIAAVGVLLK